MRKFPVQGNLPSSGYRKSAPETTEAPKSFKLEGTSAIDIKKLAANEEDERYRYLLKHGIVKRVEDEDKIIFAELRLLLDNYTPSLGREDIIFKKLEVYFSKIIPPYLRPKINNLLILSNFKF